MATRYGIGIYPERSHTGKKQKIGVFDGEGLR